MVLKGLKLEEKGEVCILFLDFYLVFCFLEC